MIMLVTCLPSDLGMKLGPVTCKHGTRGVTGIFFRGGTVIFPDFFSRRDTLFPGGNSHFGRPKSNSSGLVWKVKAKPPPKKTNKQTKNKKQKKKQNKTKQNKKILSSFCKFSSLHFQFSTFPFSIFLLFFSIFPCLSFPGRSAEIYHWEVLGAFYPLPPAVTPLLRTAITQRQSMWSVI